MKKLITVSVLLSAISALFQFCKKEYDNPPLQIADDRAQVNISQLKARVPSTSSYYKFGTGDTNLYCVVIADESSGNIYKQVFVQDYFNGAIQLNLKNSGGLAVGDKIRVNLNGLYLINANNMVYIDSVDVGKNIVKLSSGNPVTPKVVTMSQILAGSVPGNSNSLQSQLVVLNDVEFIEKEKTFADAIGKQTINRSLRLCNSNSTLTVRTSGYANFASKTLPSGNGSIVGIVTQYNSTMQFTIRDYNEVQLIGTGCQLTLGTPVNSINEPFTSQTSTNNPIGLTGWINTDEFGTRSWNADVNAGNYRAKATSYLSSDNKNKIWLISPPVIANATPTLSFKSAKSYDVTGHPNPLTVWISTTYNGANLSTAGTWTAITSASIAPLSGTDFTFVNSGTVNLSQYLPASYTGTYCIGFCYYGSFEDNHTTNYYLDDIKVQ